MDIAEKYIFFAAFFADSLDYLLPTFADWWSYPPLADMYEKPGFILCL